MVKQTFIRATPSSYLTTASASLVAISSAVSSAASGFALDDAILDVFYGSRSLCCRRRACDRTLRDQIFKSRHFAACVGFRVSDSDIGALEPKQRRSMPRYSQQQGNTRVPYQYVHPSPALRSASSYGVRRRASINVPYRYREDLIFLMVLCLHQVVRVPVQLPPRNVPYNNIELF